MRYKVLDVANSCSSVTSATYWPGPLAATSVRMWASWGASRVWQRLTVGIHRLNWSALRRAICPYLRIWASPQCRM